MWPFTSKAKPKTATKVNRVMVRPVALRGFDAAKVNRLTEGFGTQNTAMDYDLRTALPVLRSRSRNVTVNDPYGRKFLGMVKNNVVGPTGFSMKVKVTDVRPSGAVVADELASNAIEGSFWEWAMAGNCDVTGKLSFFDICNLYISGCAREGEVLIRKVYGAAAGNKWGFALQVLDTDRLDIEKNDALLPGGGYIRMGVEFTSVGRPVAYWLRVKHPGDTAFGSYTGQTHERVAAEDMFHHFLPERPEQSRGIPWLHAVLTDMHHLDAFDEAALIAARSGASHGGFFTSPEGDAQQLADGQGANEELMYEVEPGVWKTLPPGVTPVPYTPPYPNQIYADFTKQFLRRISSGALVAYNSFANDLEGVNFSSIRTGVLEERDGWMCLQNWMIEQFLIALSSTWLRYALLNRAILLPNGSALPLSRLDKFNKFTWRGRRWQWVDPMKDAETGKTLNHLGVKTRRQIAEELGLDLDDVLVELAAEQQKIEELGLEVEKPKSASAPAAPPMQASDQPGGEA